MKWTMKKNGIEWSSSRKHIIISKRESFFNEDKNIFVIYQEKRYYPFESNYFYNVEWHMIRWEYELDKAIKFANNISDEYIKVYR